MQDLPLEFQKKCEAAPLPKDDKDEIQAAIFIREQELYSWMCINKDDKLIKWYNDSQAAIKKRNEAP